MRRSFFSRKPFLARWMGEVEKGLLWRWGGVRCIDFEALRLQAGRAIDLQGRFMIVDDGLVVLRYLSGCP